MSESRDNDSGDDAGGQVLDLSRSRDRVRRARQDRAAAELATRFHRAMGWKGPPGTSGDGKGGKSSKRKKKR